MTNQEIFDKVCNHLITQSQRSINNQGDCLYRGPKGLSCAIGCLITDEEYSPDLEGMGVQSKVVIKSLEASGVDLGHGENHHRIDFLRELQDIHDILGPIAWRVVLNSFAKRFCLSKSSCIGS